MQMLMQRVSRVVGVPTVNIEHDEVIRLAAQSTRNALR
jgi:hypothetical protein